MIKSFAPLLVFALGCGGAQSTGAPPPGMPWKEMDATQRKVYMKRTVLPEMRRVFAEFDPKFANMTCVTCHGDGVEDTSFEMPNPDLWVMPSEAGWATFVPDEKTTKWLEFMGGKVKPAMAKLLGMSDYDWQTKQGEFNCAHCHTSAAE